MNEVVAVSPTVLREVAAQLVEAAAMLEAAAGPAADGPSVILPRQGEWTLSMVERLRPVVASYSGAMTLLDVAASRADETIEYSMVLETADISDHQLRSDLGAMTKASRRLFGRKTWPLKAWQGPRGTMKYEMPEQIATWWEATK